MDIKSLTDFCVDCARDLGASYAEARSLIGFNTATFMRNGTLVNLAKTPFQGVGVRILKSGSLSFCSIDVIDKDIAKKISLQ